MRYGSAQRRAEYKSATAQSVNLRRLRVKPRVAESHAQPVLKGLTIPAQGRTAAGLSVAVLPWEPREKVIEPKAVASSN